MLKQGGNGEQEGDHQERRPHPRRVHGEQYSCATYDPKDEVAEAALFYIWIKNEDGQQVNKQNKNLCPGRINFSFSGVSTMRYVKTCCRRLDDSTPFSNSHGTHWIVNIERMRLRISEFQMQPQSRHSHRTADLVISGVVDVLQVKGEEDTAPHVRGVEHFLDGFAAVR